MGGFKDKDKQRAIVKENFKKYVESINKIPSYNEMRKTPIGFKYLSASSIERNFGSYNALLEELGYEKNKQPNQYNNETFFTKDQIIDSINEICGNNLCYVSTYYHNHKSINMPGLKAIKLHFGSWYEFLVSQKIIKSYTEYKQDDPSKRTIYKIICNDDHQCDSQEEAVIDYWLTKNNIQHVVHPKYLAGKYKADFFLPKHGVYLEYAGCLGRGDYTEYNKKLTNKLEIAKSCGMNVIVIQRSDLDNLDEVLKSLINCPLKTNSN